MLVVDLDAAAHPVLAANCCRKQSQFFIYIDKIKRAILESHKGAVDVDYTIAAAEA